MALPHNPIPPRRVKKPKDPFSSLQEQEPREPRKPGHTKGYAWEEETSDARIPERESRGPKYADLDRFRTTQPSPDRSGAPVREYDGRSTPAKDRHQDFTAVVPRDEGCIIHGQDMRGRMARLRATLFQGVPYGTYVNAAPGKDGKKETSRWQLSVTRDDTAATETAVIYGFMNQNIVPGRYRIIGVRNSRNEIEVDRLENLDANTPIAIEQMPAGLLRFVFLLILLVPMGLIAGGIAHSGSIGAFFAQRGDYLLLYTAAILLAALYIWFRVRQHHH